MSSTTAGISPLPTGTFSAGRGAPVTLRAVVTISFTVTDRPEPRISGPLCRPFQVVRMPCTTSSTCTTSRSMLPSPRTWTPSPSRAARISRGMKLSFSPIPGPYTLENRSAAPVMP